MNLTSYLIDKKLHDKSNFLRSDKYVLVLFGWLLIDKIREVEFS